MTQPVLKSPEEFMDVAPEYWGDSNSEDIFKHSHCVHNDIVYLDECALHASEMMQFGIQILKVGYFILKVGYANAYVDPYTPMLLDVNAYSYPIFDVEEVYDLRSGQNISIVNLQKTMTALNETAGILAEIGKQLEQDGIDPIELVKRAWKTSE